MMGFCVSLSDNNYFNYNNDMIKVMVKSDVFNFNLKSYGVDVKYLANKSGIPLEKIEMLEAL